MDNEDLSEMNEGQLRAEVVKLRKCLTQLDECKEKRCHLCHFCVVIVSKQEPYEDLAPTRILSIVRDPANNQFGKPKPENK